MDEAINARIRGELKLAICSAATKSSVLYVLDNLVGKDRLKHFDVILAGDDVDEKKPSPKIYNVAREKLQVDAENCVVIEDSLIGLQAALAAGMQCIITFTSSTKSQPFHGARQVYPELGDDPTTAVHLSTLFPSLTTVSK